MILIFYSYIKTFIVSLNKVTSFLQVRNWKEIFIHNKPDFSGLVFLHYFFFFSHSKCLFRLLTLYSNEISVSKSHLSDDFVTCILKSISQHYSSGFLSSPFFSFSSSAMSVCVSLSLLFLLLVCSCLRFFFIFIIFSFSSPFLLSFFVFFSFHFSFLFLIFLKVFFFFFLFFFPFCFYLHLLFLILISVSLYLRLSLLCFCFSSSFSVFFFSRPYILSS